MSAEWKGNPSADLARSERRWAWGVAIVSVLVNAALIGWLVWKATQ